MIKKIKTIADIKADPRVDQFIYQYDGRNKHGVVLKDGYGFDGERSLDLGNIKELCYSMNNTIQPYNHK